MPNKEIPTDILDKGCEYWANKKAAKLIKHIITTFNGEILK